MDRPLVPEATSPPWMTRERLLGACGSCRYSTCPNLRMGMCEPLKLGAGFLEKDCKVLTLMINTR